MNLRNTGAALEAKTSSLLMRAALDVVWFIALLISVVNN
jgi:hypothetical protein